jgi:hypothetical protein
MHKISRLCVVRCDGEGGRRNVPSLFRAVIRAAIASTIVTSPAKRVAETSSVLGTEEGTLLVAVPMVAVVLPPLEGLLVRLALLLLLLHWSGPKYQSSPALSDICTVERDAGGTNTSVLIRAVCITSTLHFFDDEIASVPSATTPIAGAKSSCEAWSTPAVPSTISGTVTTVALPAIRSSLRALTPSKTRTVPTSAACHRAQLVGQLRGGIFATPSLTAKLWFGTPGNTQC